MGLEGSWPWLVRKGVRLSRFLTVRLSRADRRPKWSAQSFRRQSTKIEVMAVRTPAMRSLSPSVWGWRADDVFSRASESTLIDPWNSPVKRESPSRTADPGGPFDGNAPSRHHLAVVTAGSASWPGTSTTSLLSRSTQIWISSCISFETASRSPPDRGKNLPRRFAKAVVRELRVAGGGRSSTWRRASFSGSPRDFQRRN